MIIFTFKSRNSCFNFKESIEFLETTQHQNSEYPVETGFLRISKKLHRIVRKGQNKCYMGHFV